MKLPAFESIEEKRDELERNVCEKAINKIEIFLPKRKYLAPKEYFAFIKKGEQHEVFIKGVRVLIKNEKSTNCYLRLT